MASGETIEIEATFSTSVDVDGNPGLGLRVDSDWRSARYLRGSGSDKLVFGYTVKSTDSDTDGIRMPGGYQDNDGRWHNLNDHTAITASGTEKVVSRVYAGIDDQLDHKLDGRPIAGLPQDHLHHIHAHVRHRGRTTRAPIHLNARVNTRSYRRASILVKTWTQVEMCMPS